MILFGIKWLSPSRNSFKKILLLDSLNDELKHLSEWKECERNLAFDKLDNQLIVNLK